MQQYRISLLLNSSSEGEFQHPHSQMPICSFGQWAKVKTKCHDWHKWIKYKCQRKLIQDCQCQWTSCKWTLFKTVKELPKMWRNTVVNVGRMYRRCLLQQTQSYNRNKGFRLEFDMNDVFVCGEHTHVLDQTAL
jgi:hypothetical protein